MFLSSFIFINGFVSSKLEMYWVCDHCEITTNEAIEYDN